MVPGFLNPRFPDDFFDDQPEWSFRLCAELRDIIQSTLPEARECIKWGGVCYELGGLLCGIGSFKHHIGLNFFRGAELPDPDGVLNSGQGSVLMRGLRLKAGDRIPDEALRGILLCAADLNLSGVKRSVPRVTRPPLVVPEDFAKLLAKSKAAAAWFAKCSPSCQREYVGWIEQAKRPETRQKRMLASIEYLTTGRRVYEKRMDR